MGKLYDNLNVEDSAALIDEQRGSDYFNQLMDVLPEYIIFH